MSSICAPGWLGVCALESSPLRTSLCKESLRRLTRGPWLLADSSGARTLRSSPLLHESVQGERKACDPGAAAAC